MLTTARVNRGPSNWILPRQSPDSMPKAVKLHFPDSHRDCWVALRGSCVRLPDSESAAPLSELSRLAALVCAPNRMPLQLGTEHDGVLNTKWHQPCRIGRRLGLKIQNVDAAGPQPARGW